MVNEESAFQQRMQRIEGLIGQIESSGQGSIQAMATELVSLVMELHGNGISRMVELLKQSGLGGIAAIEQFAEDPLIGSLLVLYGLHPQTLEERIDRGLAAARPYLESHGGNVELVTVDAGRVVLRLAGNCHGCPSSAQTMRTAIEDAIYEFAPDVVSIELETASDLAEPAGFVSLHKLA